MFDIFTGALGAQLFLFARGGKRPCIDIYAMTRPTGLHPAWGLVRRAGARLRRLFNALRHRCGSADRPRLRHDRG